MNAADRPLLDHSGAQVLTDDECRRLLDATDVGRIAFVHDGDVVILPINIGLWGRSLVFSTQPGSKLDAAVMARHVSIEVDQWDSASKSGWSVLVKGVASTVEDEDEAAALDRSPVQPWVRPDVPRTWVRVRPDEITGRRIGAS